MIELHNVSKWYGTVQVLNNCSTRIAKGDLPPRITEAYQGDFNLIKLSLNECLGALGGLVEEMNRMSGEHEKGDIDAQVDAARFQGAYRAMAQGVNRSFLVAFMPCC
jgi:methyl-accepting chemotaxis protein